jgi:hypothetical protein
MPTLFRIRGYHVAFYAADRNEPPHVHVTHENKEAKFWMTPFVRLARNKGFRPHELTEIEKVIVARAEEILETWHGYFRH